MIFRAGYWPVGATNIWFNSTNDQVFPRAVSADSIHRGCINSSIVLGEVICPSSGWQNIAGLAPFERNNIGPAMSKWANVGTVMNGDAGLPSSIQLPGKAALRTLYLCTRVGEECFDTLTMT